MQHRLSKIHRHKLQSAQGGKSGLAALIVLVVLVGAASLALANRQSVADWYQLRNYQAPTAVADLASQDTMTDYTRKVFYVNNPQLSDKAKFRTECPNADQEEKTIILGCYKGSQSGIYLLQVQDARLNGVVQVTAAHETLHAIYDRLSSKDRQYVDGLLQDYYAHELKDERIKGIIESYKKTEPNDLVNEMHSIFGTEITSLPIELEEYYAQYFTNRSQIVGFATKYQAEFTSRQSAVAQADARLVELKTQITAAQTNLDQQEAAITSQRAQLTSLRDAGSTGAYNVGVPVYNNLVNAYNNNVAETKQLIVTYNQLVAERNAIAFEASQLSQELNAGAEPIAQ